MNGAKCVAGFARLDITPPLGAVMGGYLHVQRFVDGVLDPLYVRAVAFGEEDRRAVLLSVDQCEMHGESGFELSVLVARELGLPREAVFMTMTHSHTTPCIADEDFFGHPCDEQYDKWLFRRLCDAARMALDDCKPVLDVRAAERDVGGLTYVRRYRMKDGTVINGPPAATQEDLDKIEGPIGKADTTMRLVRILREDAPELILINFQSHPDNIGGSKVSADFPGAVCARVEEQVPNSRCVFLNGAMGNLVITDRTKLVIPGKRYEKAMALGVKIADEALVMYDSAPSAQTAGLTVAQDFARVRSRRDPSKERESAEIIARFRKEGLWAVHPVRSMCGRTIMNAIILDNLERMGADSVDLPISALVFCGVALVGISGEPFSAMGEQIRAASRFPVTCVCGLTNGSFGYFPMAADYDDGGYEAGGADAARGGAEQLIEAAANLLARL